VWFALKQLHNRRLAVRSHIFRRQPLVVPLTRAPLRRRSLWVGAIICAGSFGCGIALASIDKVAERALKKKNEAYEEQNLDVSLVTRDDSRATTAQVTSVNTRTRTSGLAARVILCCQVFVKSGLSDYDSHDTLLTFNEFGEGV
jgi:hypothetical protein